MFVQSNNKTNVLEHYSNLIVIVYNKHIKLVYSNNQAMIAFFGIFVTRLSNPL